MSYITFQPSDHFNVKLYTGNGSTQSITGVGFQPDFVWIKDRTNTYDNAVFDAIRGATKRIVTNSGNGESTASTDLTSFESDGFNLGAGSNVNNNSNNFVSWNWKMNGAGSSNSDGSVTSTVSVNSTADMSIVTWTGTGSAATIGHGLSGTPDYIIVKCLASGENWMIWSNLMAANEYLRLSTNAAIATGSNEWNNTLPAASVFTVGSENTTNKSGAGMVAYCFKNVKGFSHAGSYIGNGNGNGIFAYTGFKPKFILFKRAVGGTDSWFINDTARATFNPSTAYMRPNETSAEGTSSAHKIDIVSNGFKVRSTDTAYNTSGNTYTYLAFAEEPLVSSNNLPATAR